MSESLVMQRRCERCPAIDETTVSAADIISGKVKMGKAEGPIRYEIKVEGKSIAAYGYLCGPCETAVKKAVEDISKKREKKSSTRS
jgi:hypothetical protein